MTELTENLCRDDPGNADLALSVSRVKTLNEETYAGSKHGGDRSKVRNLELAPFADYISELFGYGMTKMHNLLNRAEAHRAHAESVASATTEEMTPSSVTILWRHEKRGSRASRPRQCRSLFRTKELPASEVRRHGGGYTCLVNYHFTGQGGTEGIGK